ncbi:MAG: alpha/beta fold hydrolase [Thermoleophilaceae bacterium]
MTTGRVGTSEVERRASERTVDVHSCVLVHGGWHGGWHWDEVAARLRQMGGQVFAPTLRGLADRADEATPETNLMDHVADVVAVIDEEKLSDVVLVGHSYGGVVISGAAHQRPDRIAQLVYLDAFVPHDGQSVGDILGSEFRDAALAAAAAAGTPSMIPPLFSVEDILGWTGDRASAFAARMCPHPVGTLDDPITLDGHVDAERSYVYCSARPLGLVERFAAAAREADDWRYFELPSPHDAVHAMPAAVAGIIAFHMGL